MHGVISVSVELSTRAEVCFQTCFHFGCAHFHDDLLNSKVFATSELPGDETNIHLIPDTSISFNPLYPFLDCGQRLTQYQQETRGLFGGVH